VLPAQIEVLSTGAWVTIEVVTAIELQRIDEDADHHHIGVSLRLVDEREMTVV
jgi:hypothetical protein